MLMTLNSVFNILKTMASISSKQLSECNWLKCYIGTGYFTYGIIHVV